MKTSFTFLFLLVLTGMFAASIGIMMDSLPLGMLSFVAVWVLLVFIGMGMNRRSL